VFRQLEENKYRFWLVGLAGGGIMETLRSVLVPALHTFAVRGHNVLGKGHWEDPAERRVAARAGLTNGLYQT
jgi:hypothetical protein